MTQETYKTISDMMGDNRTDFIAKTLKDTYNDLLGDLSKLSGLVPIISTDPIEEAKYILAKLEALENVYSWYATDNIKD
jgi:hypothetical protein